MELYSYAKARPTPWSPSVLEGTVTGNARQDFVLVTSPRVKFMDRPFARLPAALFDAQICPAVRRRGGEVVFV